MKTENKEKLHRILVKAEDICGVIAFCSLILWTLRLISEVSLAWFAFISIALITTILLHALNNTRKRQQDSVSKKTEELLDTLEQELAELRKKRSSTPTSHGDLTEVEKVLNQVVWKEIELAKKALSRLSESAAASGDKEDAIYASDVVDFIDTLQEAYIEDGNEEGEVKPLVSE